jgi:hypothetical protein
MEEYYNTQYGEDTLLDKAEILANFNSEKETWQDVHWNLDELTNLDALLNEYNKEEISGNDLWRISSKLGRLSKKLDLSGGLTTITTLRHTMGLVKLALHLYNAGSNIHLIESCGPDGTQHWGDVDLLYQNIQGLHHLDYTSGNCQDGKMRVFSRHEKPQKYRDADQYKPVDSKSVVACFGFRFDIKRITHNVFDRSPREDDFKFADSLINVSPKMPVELCEDMLKHYVSSLGKSPNRSEMVQTPGLYVSAKELGKLLPMIERNDVDSAKMHKKLKELMTEKQETEHRGNMSKFYSFDYFSKLESMETKWHIPFPMIKRGTNSVNVFDRLNDIVIENKRCGKTCSPFTIMLAMLKDHEHVTHEMISDMGIFGTTYLTGVTASRVYRNGEQVEAVKLQFPAGSNLLSMKESMKEMAPVTYKSSDLCQLEEMYSKFLEDESKPGYGGQMLDDLDSMIEDVGQEGPLTEFVKKAMRLSFDTVRTTKTGTRLCLMQELTYALLNGPRKRRKVKCNVGSVKDTTIIMGLNTISDRYGVVCYNLGPLTFGDIKDVGYILHGVFEESKSTFIKPTLHSHTTFLSMSPAQLDWNTALLHKAISWSSLSYETALVSCPSRLPRLKHECVLPLQLSFLNSNKFSQVADQTRYLFVNGIGMTSGPSPLIEKISWYRPKTHIEKMYVMRLLKMNDALSLHKALNVTEHLLKKQTLNIDEQQSLSMKMKVRGWTIAMPDESEYSLSQQHTFNSFYNSRALTIQRYNKIMSESLVIEKQLDAREEYLNIKFMNYEHEGRNRQCVTSVKDLYSMVTNSDFGSSQACPYSPDPLVIYLGFVSSILQHRLPDDETVGDILKRVYNVDGVMRTMDVASVMNNRGSVTDAGKNGVIRTHKKTVVEHGKDKVTKNILHHQNSKCYKTILMAMSNMSKGILPSKTASYDELEVKEEDMVTDDLNLTMVSKLPDKLAPLVLYFSENEAACVSKMVHKDQLGAREIAVLNSASRVMCKYVEDVARHVRDSDVSKGLKTNLIEIKDKRDIVVNTLNEYNALKKVGYIVMFDSADCSKFGPTQMPSALYLSLSLRIPTGVNHTLRNCLTLFGNKVFKIPDATYLMRPPKEGDSKISNIYERVTKMSPEMGSWEKQVFYLEESMHQGILGCSSSVLASDAQHLSNWAMIHNYRDFGMKVKSHLTSDDYSRAIAWKREKQPHIYSIMKDSLALHNQVLLQMGIKRNLQKSSLSRDYFEFNSEFFTSMGEIRPDIKSRLSYVDVSPDTDPYPVALRPMNQATEYLRSEGSYVGACWTFVLNNALAMYQNQSRRLWKRLGTKIYEVPLELGGLIKPDVLQCSISHGAIGLRKNYEPRPNADLSELFSVLLESQSCEPTLIEMTDGEGQKLQIPSLSRSGTVHLCKRTPRQTRAIREFLLTCDPSDYRDVYNSRFGSSIVLALMSCAQREITISKEEGSAFRFMVTQTSRTAPLYRINSQFMRKLTDCDKISRDQLHQIALNFLETRSNIHFSMESPIEVSQIMAAEKTLATLYRTLNPELVTLMPRITYYHSHRETYAPDSYVNDRLTEYEMMYLPTSLGGSSKLHPWTYLEGRMTYTNFLRKLSMRRQAFRFSLRESDLNTSSFAEMILRSNFMAGSRLSYSYKPDQSPRKAADYLLTQAIGAIHSETRWNDNGIVADLMSPEFSALMRTDKVKAVNITNLVNAVIGDSQYMIRSQTVQSMILSELMSKTEWKSRLVVDPMNLSTMFSSMRFVSSEGIKLWQRPLIGSNGPSGRQVIVLADNVFHHYNYDTLFETTPMLDTKRDKYSHISLLNHNWIKVSIRDTLGYTMLEETYTRRPIQVLTSTNLKKNKVRIYTKTPLQYDDNFMSRLYDAMNRDILSSKIIEVYEATENLREDDEFSHGSEDEETMNQRLLMESQFLSDEESDFDVDADFAKFLEDNDLSDEEIQEDQAILDINPVSTVIDEPTRVGEEIQEEPRGYSAPVSSQGSMRQQQSKIVDMARSSVSYVSKQAISAAGRFYGQRFHHGYYLELPVTLSQEVYTDADGESAFEKIFKDLQQLDELDRIWLTDFILASFINFGPISIEVDQWIKSKDKSVNDEDDFDGEF